MSTCIFECVVREEEEGGVWVGSVQSYTDNDRHEGRRTDRTSRRQLITRYPNWNKPREVK